MRILAIILVSLLILFVGCSYQLMTPSREDCRVREPTQKYLMNLAVRFPEIIIKEGIPIEEVWTDLRDDLGGDLKSWQYVESENVNEPFYRIYINVLVLFEGTRSRGYAKFHVIVEQWEFDAVCNRFVIHYWGMMNPSEIEPYVEFRLIIKQEGRVLADYRHGFYSGGHQNLVNKTRRVMRQIIDKKMRQEQMPSKHTQLEQITIYP
jgi:hypothetical protein